MEPVRVAVCVATYARPDGLARVLDGIAQQIVGPPATDRSIAIRAVVVDNDPAGPSRTVCDVRARDFPLGLRYEVEPRRGITFARNHAVTAAGNDVDFIAFLDDDEVPEPGWLATLLRVQATYNADVVSGPVVPYFPVAPSAWILEGRFFDRPRYPTGHALTHALTGNALIRPSVFESTGRFDDRFALTGGEDLQFFRRAAATGHRIVWADEARVDEWVPVSRANLRWLLRRAYRAGSTLGQLDRDRPDAVRARPARVARGAVRVMQGMLLAPVAAVLPARRSRVARALLLMWRGAGMITGALGGRYEEYRVVHPV
jgi:succinoglycan biosynthesis protein ExoM